MSCASASSSSAATLSTAPARACIRAPPSSSLSGASPIPAIATTGGPATNSWAVPLTITEKCEQTDTRRAEPRHRPERGRRHRHDRQVLHHEVEAGQRRHVGEAHLLERLDAAAAARAVHEPDEREAQVVGQALGVDGLLPDRGVGGAAADGEVVALHDRAAAVDAALADDRVRGQELGQLAVLVVGAAAGERSGLVEAARVEEPLDPLANRQPAGRVLALDPLLAAHPPRELLAPAQLLELGLPGHRAQTSAGQAPRGSARLARERLARRLLAQLLDGRRAGSSPRSRRRSRWAASRRGSSGRDLEQRGPEADLAGDSGHQALQLDHSAERRVAR